MSTYDELLNKVKILAEKEKETIKHYLWDKYVEEGCAPKLIRDAFNEAIEAIEKEENKLE